MRISVAVSVACAAICFACAPVASSTPLTVAQFLAAPPVGTLVDVAGYVVDSYYCPPCPRGAMCKPCASKSRISIADAPAGTQTLDVLLWGADPNPRLFHRNVRYEFEITIGEYGAALHGYREPGRRDWIEDLE